MQRFSAKTFYHIAQWLLQLQKSLEGRIKQGNLTRESPMEKGDSEGTRCKILKGIKTSCSEIGLTVSVKCAQSVIDLYLEGTTAGYFLDNVDHLKNTIALEMEDKLFMYVPPDRACFYGAKELFGVEVNNKFPGIQFDLVEAGNCYASGRGTAVVFHLMRIMEIGVQQLGTKLGVGLANEKNWQNILNEVNKAIASLSKSKAPGTVEMSQASANLYAVKLAWRNEVMHPNDTYTLEEADNLIRQVRIFMQQLATIV
jgi:hypothetical protein